jgi:hypothetical protein
MGSDATEDDGTERLDKEQVGPREVSNPTISLQVGGGNRISLGRVHETEDHLPTDRKSGSDGFNIQT